MHVSRGGGGNENSDFIVKIPSLGVANRYTASENEGSTRRMVTWLPKQGEAYRRNKCGGRKESRFVQTWQV